MFQRQIGQSTWYVVCAEYRTAKRAKAAWENVDRNTAGKGGLGFIRCAPAPAGEPTVSTGARPGMHAVIGVTTNRRLAGQVETLLSDGTPFVPAEGFARAMILRRIRVLAQHGDRTGRMTVRMPEGRGARMDADGNVEIPPGRDT